MQLGLRLGLVTSAQYNVTKLCEPANIHVRLCLDLSPGPAAVLAISPSHHKSTDPSGRRHHSPALT